MPSDSLASQSSRITPSRPHVITEAQSAGLGLEAAATRPGIVPGSEDQPPLLRLSPPTHDRRQATQTKVQSTTLVTSPRGEAESMVHSLSVTSPPSYSAECFHSESRKVQRRARNLELPPSADTPTSWLGPAPCVRE